MEKRINKLCDELRNSRTDISQLLDNAWEIGGYAVGEEEFESYIWVKSARQQLDTIDTVLKLQQSQEDLSRVSRVEVIDENGRSYTNYSVKEAEVSMQDDNRTMKIFITSNNPNENRKDSNKK